ncbi:ferric-chelate reductase [Plakobranchus ocellatus]|uniref:Ferric-chelate reductase n=1 Tax=Plakobranchus ocellatus TaxID=259542 RepID=A0AAV3YGK7_9GAST|nr:ferric-chelate reductase [Plakobranchus ocellatus]
MWREEGDSILFDVRANQVTSRAEEYIAVAFSKDTKMGSDSVVECTESDFGNKVHVSYNGRFKNELMKELDNTVLPIQRMRAVDGVIHCQFARKKSQRGEDRVFDLENDYYVLVAQGHAKNGRKQEHGGLPAISEKVVDFQERYMVVTPLLIDRIFIKTHACVMVFAWLFCASIGTVVARFYKPLWPHKTLCKRKVWFTVSIQRFRKLHPVVGIVTTFVVIVQIVLGIFRPHSSSENRPVFNWGHWLLGIITHILTVFNMMLGVGLKKASVHPSVLYVLYAFAVYQVLAVIVLEIIFCNIRVKVRKQQSYSIYEIRNAIYSSTKDILDATVSEPPGSFLLRVLLFVHVLIITSFTAAVIFVIAFIDQY